MGRYLGARCRLCRRHQTKLMLKGSRCYSAKCALERREYPPGQHGPRRGRTLGRLKEYGLQLHEKQKARRIYGMGERAFRTLLKRAVKMKGVTGENFLQMLEQRLDNVVYRIGFASSRASARQVVRHGLIEVDGRKVDVPSVRVKPGQEVRVRRDAMELLSIKGSLETANSMGVPPWIDRNSTDMSGKLLRLPDRSELSLPVEEQLIVELYTR